MGAFYITIVSTYIFNILARISYDKKYRGLAIFWGILVAIILVAVSGLRDGIGDTPFYKHSFNLLDIFSPNFSLVSSLNCSK